MKNTETKLPKALQNVKKSKWFTNNERIANLEARESELTDRIKTLDGLHSEMVNICNHHLMQIEEIKKYADHKDDCNKFGEFFRPEDQECTCGFDELMEG